MEDAECVRKCLRRVCCLLKDMRIQMMNEMTQSLDDGYFMKGYESGVG